MLKKEDKSIKRSIKDKNKTTVFKSNEDNIPLYNNDFISNKIQKREQNERKEQEKQEKEKEKDEKRLYRKSLIHISQINEYLLVTCSLLIVLAVLSIVTKNFNYVLYSVLGVISSLYMGRRLKINYDETFNILVWNITQALKDFIEYKISIDVFDNRKNKIEKFSITFSFITILFNSNSIVWGFGFIFIMIIYLISFSERDMESLNNCSHKIILASIAGLVIKTIFNTALNGQITIDYMNVVVIDLFVFINYFSSICNISEPKD